MYQGMLLNIPHENIQYKICVHENHELQTI